MMSRAIVGAAALVTAASAVAQTRLEAPGTAGWKHAQTGIVLRASLAGFQRQELKDLSSAELDVSASYWERDETLATIFVFRPALASLPIWFDRAETRILMNDSWKGARFFTPPMAFIPPGASTPSGLSRVYVPGSQSGAKSTALAMMPYKDWLVAVRMTSKSLDPSVLGSRLSEFVKAIELPAVAQSIVAQPIATCADVPKYDKRAKLVKPDMSSVLIGAALIGAVRQGEGKVVKPTVPVTWCKQAANAEYGVYRANGAKDAYTLALGDAGVIANVSPTLMLDGKPAYQLSLGQLDKTLIYPNFNRFPAPEKAYKALNKSSPVSSVAGGNTITIGN